MTADASDNVAWYESVDPADWDGHPEAAPLLPDGWRDSWTDAEVMAAIAYASDPRDVDALTAELHRREGPNPAWLEAVTLLFGHRTADIVTEAAALTLPDQWIAQVTKHADVWPPEWADRDFPPLDHDIILVRVDTMGARCVRLRDTGGWHGPRSWSAADRYWDEACRQEQVHSGPRAPRLPDFLTAQEAVDEYFTRPGHERWPNPGPGQPMLGQWVDDFQADQARSDPAPAATVAQPTRSPSRRSWWRRRFH